MFPLLCVGRRQDAAAARGPGPHAQLLARPAGHRAAARRLRARPRRLYGLHFYSGLSSSVRSSCERFEELRGVGQRLREDLARLSDTTRLLQASSPDAGVKV